MLFHVIVSSAVATDRVTGGRRDFAHVQFADAESARRARDEMRGQLIDGEAGTNGGGGRKMQSNQYRRNSIVFAKDNFYFIFRQSPLIIFIIIIIILFIFFFFFAKSAHIR